MEFKIVSNLTGNQVIMSSRPDDSNSFFLNVQSDGDLEFNFEVSGTTLSVTTSSTPLTPDQEYHVVLRKEGANLDFYVDGQILPVSAYSSKDSYSGTVTWTNVLIGKQFADSSFFDGELFWFAIYERALNPIEITDNFTLANDMNMTGYDNAFGKLSLFQKAPQAEPSFGF